jgi:hypothetical protein
MSGGILDFVQVHPYLFANLPLLGLVLLLPRLTPNRDYERAAIFSGLACLPCSLARLRPRNTGIPCCWAACIAESRA